MKRLTDEEWPEPEDRNCPMVGCMFALPLAILLWAIFAAAVWVMFP